MGPRGPPAVRVPVSSRAVKYDLVDRRCIVTGASAGIGKEIARNLAYFGATVVLACRDRERGSAALDEIVHDSGNDRVTMLQVDMGNPTSVRAFVRNVTAGRTPLHVLVNNAATICPTRQLTAEGVELTWATNVLGYFMLTCLLLPTLRRVAPSRIVNVACSDAGALDLGDVSFDRRRYDPMTAYRQSKAADRMISWRLAERCRAQGVTVHACDPGPAATSLRPPTGGFWGRIVGVGRSAVARPASTAALTPTFVAAAPEVAEITGRWWVEQKPAECAFTRETATMDELWAICARQTGVDV